MFFKLFETLNTYVAYTAVVLPSDQQQILVDKFKSAIPADWKVYAHHMTINMKTADKGPAAHLIGQSVPLKVDSYGKNELALAAGITTEVGSTNLRKHITIATSPEGRPQHSNDIEMWFPIHPFVVYGVVSEVEQEGELPLPKPIRPPAEAAPNDPREFVKFMLRKGKPLHVIKGALAGKFPGTFFTDAEIENFSR